MAGLGGKIPVGGSDPQLPPSFPGRFNIPVPSHIEQVLAPVASRP